jgi:hypothetical protein
VSAFRRAGCRFNATLDVVAAKGARHGAQFVGSGVTKHRPDWNCRHEPNGLSTGALHRGIRIVRHYIGTPVAYIALTGRDTLEKSSQRFPSR